MYIWSGNQSIFEKEKGKNLVAVEKNFEETIEWRQLYNDIVKEKKIDLTQPMKKWQLLAMFSICGNCSCIECIYLENEQGRQVFYYFLYTFPRI